MVVGRPRGREGEGLQLMGLTRTDRFKNPMVCVCREPDVRPGTWGMCARCLRKPLALFRVLR